MKLPSFIREHKEEIAEEWVLYARNFIKITAKMDLYEVRDHIIEMLDRIAEDIDTAQTDSQQIAKSKGLKPPVLIDDMPAKEHGSQRVKAGFDIVELSSEFRALRASVLRLWQLKMTKPIDKDDFQDMIRFNEAIDEAWMHSMARFHAQVDESRNWLMGVLSHDLRNPLTTISTAKQILADSPNLSDIEKNLIYRTGTSVKLMTELIDNLLQLTSLRLGGGMSINKETIDLTQLSKNIIEEFRVSYPKTQLVLQSTGPVIGRWDPLRVNQMFTNLIGNSIRHGKEGGPVTIRISTEGNNAVLSVHNLGDTIPDDMWDLLHSGPHNAVLKKKHKKSYSHGLGLYIVKEVVAGHKGTVDIKSVKDAGTTFTITLPIN